MNLMYVIIVYDIKVERVNKVKGYLRTQLNWIQNSVFEGEVTPSELAGVKKNLKEIMNKSEDSIIIYTLRTENAMKRDVMGIEKAPIGGIL